MIVFSTDIKNARISAADIVFSRGFVLDCQITLEFVDGFQDFGGYVLGGNPFDDGADCSRHAEQPNIAADFIGGVMAVAEVDRFSRLVGNVVRVECSQFNGQIKSIGHPVKDIWYNPSERFRIMREARA